MLNRRPAWSRQSAVLFLISFFDSPQLSLRFSNPRWRLERTNYFSAPSRLNTPASQGGFSHSLHFSIVLYLLFFSREKALQDGLKEAVHVPLNVIKTASKVWSPMVELAKVGNINSKSDLQVRHCETF